MTIAKFALSALVVCACALPAAAGPAEPQVTTLNGYYEYRGELVITAISPTTATVCDNDGEKVGSIYTARFTPPALGKNGTNWRLSIFSLHYGQNLQFFAGNYPTATAKTVDSSDSMGRGAGAFAVKPLVAITKQVPAANSINNTYVYLEGQIRNFANNAATSLTEGCDISFRFSGNLKP